MSADARLRRDIRLLGDVRGRVLVEQEGQELLDAEERIRLRSREAREGAAWPAARSRSQARADAAGLRHPRLRALLSARQHRRAASPASPPPRVRARGTRAA